MKKAIAKSLSILGFTIPIFGCDVPDMYGTPSATYEVKGKVLDADGDPIKGIKITMKDDATAPNPYNIVESQSLGNGDYTISGRVMPTDKLYLSVEDIDGTYIGFVSKSAIFNAYRKTLLDFTSD
jgi:putative lipoprotein (rSAM/lipoprotein system)